MIAICYYEYFVVIAADIAVARTTHTHTHTQRQV